MYDGDQRVPLRWPDERLSHILMQAFAIDDQGAMRWAEFVEATEDSLTMLQGAEQWEAVDYRIPARDGELPDDVARFVDLEDIQDAALLILSGAIFVPDHHRAQIQRVLEMGDITLGPDVADLVVQTAALGGVVYEVGWRAEPEGPSL